MIDPAYKIPNDLANNEFGIDFSEIDDDALMRLMNLTCAGMLKNANSAQFAMIENAEGLEAEHQQEIIPSILKAMNTDSVCRSLKILNETFNIESKKTGLRKLAENVNYTRIILQPPIIVFPEELEKWKGETSPSGKIGWRGQGKIPKSVNSLLKEFGFDDLVDVNLIKYKEERTQKREQVIELIKNHPKFEPFRQFDDIRTYIIKHPGMDLNDFEEFMDDGNLVPGVDYPEQE